MKRIQEKIKDIVEVRPYRSLQDFISDPAETLAAYHFTDATAEMMAHWLDRLADVQIRSGAARALAGYRGVGKSHFLAALGSIAANPDLRARITNPHVAASAERLKRRRHPVAYARRGTHASLLEEIKDAIAETFEVGADNLSDSLSVLLESAAEKATDLPFVLIIDTAFDRAARVSRDDGVLLGELAERAKDLNVFIGVALDDDIAGADGVNAAIVRNYTIDYLDQEHLYRVVEAHLFPKNRNAPPLLQQIHADFRRALPGFRWSEPRFAALYPLHPVILETAPFIRLYVPDFALLGFAAEAAARILGRPANSLVALDEVFDRAESLLRKAEDLRDAFALYDRISADVISTVPVMQRLQAKLVLKALLLLSLDGDGTTATDICAAVLIYDEAEPLRARQSVEELLESFAAAFPDGIRRFVADGREARFSFKVIDKDSLNDALAEAAKTVPPATIEKVLRRFTREKFPDWALPDETEMPGADFSDCQIVWRGGARRGRIEWNWEILQPADISDAAKEAAFPDWQIIVGRPGEKASAPPAGEMPVAVWQPAPLRPDEEDALRRYYVLLTDREMRAVYGEQMHNVGHTQHVTVERIWRRIFLKDGTVVVDGFAHSFPEEAHEAANLGDLFSAALAPLFEMRYPQHPHFARNLGMSQVASLVSEHFSGAKTGLPEIQALAEDYALPLGLVVRRGASYLLETEENLLRQTFGAQVMRLAGETPDKAVPLEIVYRELTREPFGLAREAQHLVLAALVAQRMLEFVTAQGDRINRRSLDLKIIWDDIVGVALPSTVLYGGAELTNWARILTCVDTFTTIDDSRDAELILGALAGWLADWRLARVLERFEELPEEVLNTKIWQLGAGARKTFGAVAATVESVLDKTISLEEGLQRVAESFSASEKQFFKCTKDLVVLEDFINGAERREEVWRYLAVCEATENPEIEFLRAELLRGVEEITANPGEVLNRQMENAWQSFREKFVEYFAVKHDAVMKSHHLREKFDEITRGDAWWEFDNLSRLPIFQDHHRRAAQKIYDRFGELNCQFDVREMLAARPSCACSFRLSQVGEWERLSRVFEETIERGRMSYRRTLAVLSRTLAPLLESFARGESPGEFAAAARRLAETISSGEQIPLLTNAELIVLSRVARSLPASPPLPVDFPAEIGFLNQAQLRGHLNDWLDEMPAAPVLLKI